LAFTPSRLGGRAADPYLQRDGPLAFPRSGDAAIAWLLLVWCGLASTLVVTWLFTAARRFGATPFDPLLFLGAIARRRGGARRLLVVRGATLHFLTGCLLLPAAYGTAFERMGRAEFPDGLLLAVPHALLAGLALGLLGHRAARISERRWADAGPFAHRLGPLTAAGFVLLHLLYGALLAYFYVVPSR
jgi:hypothetical protein